MGLDKEKFKKVRIIIINFLSNRNILQQHSSGNIHFKRSVLLNKTGNEIIKILIGRHIILIIGKKPMCADTRSWDVDNQEKEIREANRNLQTRLMQIVTRRNLSVQLARDTPSVSELVDILATKGVIPTTEGTKSRQYADTITRVADRADRGERITQEEFVGGEYITAILWFDTILPDMES